MREPATRGGSDLRLARGLADDETPDGSWEVTDGPGAAPRAAWRNDGGTQQMAYPANVSPCPSTVHGPPSWVEGGKRGQKSNEALFQDLQGSSRRVDQRDCWVTWVTGRGVIGGFPLCSCRTEFKLNWEKGTTPTALPAAPSVDKPNLTQRGRHLPVLSSLRYLLTLVRVGRYSYVCITLPK